MRYAIALPIAVAAVACARGAAATDVAVCTDQGRFVMELADDKSPVRRAAAMAIGRLAASGSRGMVVELAHLLIADRGVAVPLALVAGLSRGEEPSELGLEIAAGILDHESAMVRRFAARYLDEFASAR